MTRIVSLSPAITETLLAIGAGTSVVGVSDYCNFPPEVKSRARAGSSLSPNYEAIALLHPTLVLAERTRSTPIAQLGAIAPVRSLPWVTLDDVITSTREIGAAVGHQPAAEELINRLSTRLARKTNVNGPRVLLVIGGPPGPLHDVWFIKRNSLHGMALEAAGGRNAMEYDVNGTPVISVERFISLNPDIVIVLAASDHLEPGVEEQYLSSFRAIPVAAVRNGALRVLHGSEVESTGPRILDFLDRLTATLHDMSTPPR